VKHLPRRLRPGARHHRQRRESYGPGLHAQAEKERREKSPGYLAPGTEAELREQYGK
jgi:hypothetical protein